MRTATPELGILKRVVRPESADLSASAARALLKLHFAESDRLYMRGLLEKSQEEKLTDSERREILSYEIVGHLLDLIHSKARRSIKKSIDKT